MSEDEDDYLSDKFLVDAAAAASAKTYSDRRKEAQRLAAIKNEQNRKKSRRELEQESREEGLRKSLFERAKDEEETRGAPSKALSMMMKMGFQPGQALGKQDDDVVASASQTPEPASADEPAAPRPSAGGHRLEPLPLNEWQGKKGIGLGKRAASPTPLERRAKMAKMADENEHRDFRDRARDEYAERRAEKQLGPAQSTCVTLDEKAGREFNVLWLNPSNPATFPEGLLDALEDDLIAIAPLKRGRPDDTFEDRLRVRMRADALQPVSNLEEDDEAPIETKETARKTPYSEEDVAEAGQFLRLPAKDRLALVLEYLRRRYAYCFWCGTQYDDDEDLEANCPGEDEDAHD